MYSKGRDLGRTASLFVRDMRFSKSTQLTVVHVHVEGGGGGVGWSYDAVGAAPRPIAFPGVSNIVPRYPQGIFEFRSVEPCAVSPELSSTESMEKTQMIAFHLIPSWLPMEAKSNMVELAA